jgi:hypothetical protein
MDPVTKRGLADAGVYGDGTGGGIGLPSKAVWRGSALAPTDPIAAPSS